MSSPEKHQQNLGQEADFEEVDLPNQPTPTLQSWNRKLKKHFSLRLQIRRRWEQYLIERLPNLSQISRVLFLWLIFISLIVGGLILQIRSLTAYYTALVPAAGGIYVEGLVGRVTNFNPLYASTEVDQTVSSLVFASLYRYNQHNQLQPVLAEPLQIDERRYTITLKPNLYWHDGQPLTIDDVIFTIQTIQDPAAQSSLRSNWQGVNLSKVDQRTLIISLETSFYPFIDNLTLGILPKHLLKDIPLNQLRQDRFNHQPVGSGPFVFERLVVLTEEELDNRELKIELRKNPHWSKVDTQAQTNFYLNGLHFWVVNSPNRLTQLFNQGRLSGAFNLIESDIELSLNSYQVANLNLMDGAYLFFKNSSPILEDRRMRYALASGLNIAQILASLDRSVQRISGPLLPEHLGYQAKSRPPVYNLATAHHLLRAAGWLENDQGWFKAGQKLKLILTTQIETDYAILARNIKKQLEENLKIEVELDLRNAENIPLEVLQNHNYGDLLIYGLNLGADADVYPYWHSSQIDSHSISRLNLAEYSSALADEALEAGRSRFDVQLRKQRYADFQKVWSDDLPALALYRFQLRYYTLKAVRGPSNNALLVTHSDRFYEVHDWAVVQKRQLAKDLL